MKIVMVKVLIVDDSRLTRLVVRDLLSRDAGISVIAEAENGEEAVQLTRDLRPDLIIMDVMMPVMDGLTAVTEIMAAYPTPILVLSGNVDPQDSRSAFNAIRLGALDVMEKPKGVVTEAFEEIGSRLAEKVKTLARVKVMHHFRRRRIIPPTTEPVKLPSAGQRSILAIGASTGGPKAVMNLLKELPKQTPCSVLIVQHIAAGFAEGFADWLNRECPFEVQTARDGEAIKQGTAYVAPNHRHLQVVNDRLHLLDSPPVNNCRPSVDVLFRSLADNGLGSKVLAVLLTGMGQDGASGMNALKDQGSFNIAQDESTSAVFGMPRAAIQMGAVHQVLPLPEISPALLKILIN